MNRISYMKELCIRFTEIDNNNYSDKICFPRGLFNSNECYKYKHLDEYGVPKIGSIVKTGDCIIGKIKVDKKSNGGINISNSSQFAKIGEHGIITSVRININNNLKTIIVKLQEEKQDLFEIFNSISDKSLEFMGFRNDKKIIKELIEKLNHCNDIKLLTFQEEDLECPICYDKIEQHNCQITKCNHKFHTQCLSEWFKKNNKCPMCRTIISATTYRNLNHHLSNFDIRSAIDIRPDIDIRPAIDIRAGTVFNSNSFQTRFDIMDEFSIRRYQNIINPDFNDNEINNFRIPHPTDVTNWIINSINAQINNSIDVTS